MASQRCDADLCIDNDLACSTRGEHGSDDAEFWHPENPGYWTRRLCQRQAWQHSAKHSSPNWAVNPDPMIR